MSSKKESVVNGFEKLWATLFTGHTHLDSALSKQAPNLKSILAQITPAILLRPVSLAESLGVGMSPDEPWGLPMEKLANWRAARSLAERLYDFMVQKLPTSFPVNEDFPPLMITEWKETWGEETTRELVNSLAQEPPLSLRASRSKGAVSLLAELNPGNSLPVKAQVSDISTLGVRLASYVPVLNTKLYSAGAFEIQDEGSQVMSHFALWPELFGYLLQEKPGKVKISGKALPKLPEDPPAWTVVDACAGAGGKSLALADALKGKGRVYSYDTSEKKLQALRRRAKNAGLNNIQAVAVEEGNESAVVGKFRRRAQVVLVDAPCSGWGVLRRNPDIKWRQPKETLDKMPKIQARLLDEYCELVAPGGRLVFGVCTFRRSETRDIVDHFVAKHPEFEAREGGYLGPGPSDGFFMQSFFRRS